MIVENPGDRAVRFINNLTLSDECQGKRMRLRPWQEEIIRKLHGTLRPDGLTQYRRSLFLIPRKQSKTEMASQITGYHILGSGKVGQCALVAASDRGQASHLFKKVKGFIERDPYLERQCVVYSTAKVIEVKKSGNLLKVLSSEGRRQHGENPSLVLIDELHAQKNRDLYDSLTSAFGARSEYLTLLISTAGETKESLLGDEYAYACKVRDGLLHDPEYLPIIYEAGDKDWTCESTWSTAMPALGDFCSLGFIRSEFQKAKEVPAEESKFRRLYLNQWVANESKFIAQHKWDACYKEPIDLDQLKGRTCYIGLDLARVIDTGSAVAVFKMDDGSYQVLPFFWLPRKRAQDLYAKGERRWLDWERDGWITLTDGETIDYDVIQAKIVELSNLYDVRKVLADPYNANQLCNNLYVSGINMGYVKQNSMGMNNPTKYLQKLILDATINHGNHPILNYMASNATVRMDSNENIHLVKKGSGKVIDGITALIDALAGWSGELDVAFCFSSV